ncbi:MAG: ABC transporter ATP-binding protein [Eubacteriaceae bacterium]|nr:ABC transporter ATP-binding protein [Eubacteriaceae bacterium]
MIKLFRFLKPYTLQIVIILVLIFLQTIGDLYLPTLMSDIINEGVMNGNTDYIWTTGGFMLLIAGLGALCAVISSFLASKVSTALGTILRNKVFERVESFSLKEFDSLGTATLITRTTNDITQVQNVVMMILRMMVSAPMMAVGGLVMAFSRDVELTGVLGIAILVLGVVIAILARKVIPLFQQVQKKIDRINLVLREKLTGVRVIRAFDTIEKENIRFEQANTDLTDNYIQVNRIMAFMMPSIMLIMNLTSLSILWFGGLQIDAGSMNLGDLSAFMQYAMQIMMSMLMLSMMFIMVPRAQAAAVRINEVLETLPSVKDPDEIKSDFVGKGHIQFENVTFCYPGAEEPVLKNISFTACPGEVTAIIGSTGSGKSTLVNLIPRFYDPADGRVLVDGVDVKESSMEIIRRKIGLVPQKAVLFSGTIAENIRYGNMDASTEEIARASEIAQAKEFIDTMEGGYDHYISQGGTNISGGQKQRLSIARALVRQPEIYIFDDSFSALDFKTDAKVRAALNKEISESTVIIVAQRVGTVMDADRIIVMDEGRVAGMGTHRELMKTCEVYKEIVSSQLSEEEIA